MRGATGRVRKVVAHMDKDKVFIDYYQLCDLHISNLNSNSIIIIHY